MDHPLNTHTEHPQPVEGHGRMVKAQPEQSDTHAVDNLVDLIEVLRSIDTTGPLAKENEATMSDNNGGRIEL
jgi:hypothetical protein